MAVWLTQIIQLIASDTGSLTYRLVLAFSIAIALYLTLSIAPAAGAETRRRRTLLGLGLLLALQFGLFLISALTWQGLIDGRLILPPLDRAASLLSLIIVIWMWCLPDPSPKADLGSMLPAAAVIAASIAAARWWMLQPDQLPFNGVYWDQIAAFFGLALALAASLFLAVRRPDGYAYGLTMLLIEVAGLGLHLYLLPYGEDYPSAFRLAQMIAYPMLGLLPLRILPAADKAAAETTAGPAVQAAPASEELQRYADPAVWAALARVAAENDPERTAREIGAALTETFDADLCALLAPPDPENNFPVRFAYDRARRRLIDAVALESGRHPTVASAWRHSRPRRLTAANGAAPSPELAALAAAFDQPAAGSLLLQPVFGGEAEPSAAVLLLSADSAHEWRPEEQEFLAQFARPMAQFLQHSLNMAALKEDLTRTRNLARAARDAAQAAVEDKSRLQGRLAVAHENAERDRLHIVELTTVASAHSEATAAVEHLTNENQALAEAARLAEKALAEHHAAYDGEMRLTLQEIGLLQAAIKESEERLAALKIDPANTSKARRQMDSVTVIAKDLRGPLGSVGSYTDMLLSETAGIVSEKQRKYLERVKVGAERMGRLLDELMLAAAPESSPGRYDSEPLDLADVVRKAAVDAEPHLTHKRIAFKIDLPPAPLMLHSDRHALYKICASLIDNAVRATPAGGPVSVGLRRENSDRNEDYALLQVGDGGGGIDPDDILRLFSPQEARTPADSGAGRELEPAAAGIPGLGAAPGDLPPLKSLVEAVGGRVWVDSEPGRGAVFSVLLRASTNPPTPRPPASESPANGRSEGERLENA